MKNTSFLESLDLLLEHSDNTDTFRKYIVAKAITGGFSATPERRRSSEASISGEIHEKYSEKNIRPKKNSLSASPITSDEIPFSYHQSVHFERLGSIADLKKGLTGIKSATSGHFPLVVTAKDRLTCDHFDFNGAAAIVPLVSSTGHGNASLNRLHYQEGKFALGTILCGIFPLDEQFISARFIYEYLSAFKDELLVSKMLGTANVTLTIGKLAETPVPIVPLGIQRKVDELMALCDQLEATRNEREAQRNRLVKSSLNRISQAPAASEEDEAKTKGITILRDAARFHLDHLPRMVTRPEHVKQLRQTILDLAVRGRLVPQDPNDEPASELLKQIQADKSVKGAFARTISHPIPEWHASLSELYLSQNWILTNLGTVTLKITDGSHKTPEYVHSGVPFISVKDFSKGALSFSNTRFIKKTQHDELYKRCDPKKGDVIIGRIGTLGKAVLIDTEKEFSLFVSVGLIRFNHDYIDPTFFVYTINSPFIEKEFDRIKVGGGTHTNKLNLGDLQTINFPLPPLPEQRLIVAKVDELMAICDDLDAQLKTTEADSRRFLEAVLRDVLEPTGAISLCL
ncbi:MAG: restriction endonuclease subunit S [Acidithiobacillus ferrooxidans]|nr:restriction endonuclease subunit S [Acidithiobacillus ferrooxidans]MDD5003957.1 restriction endonuclease subunit S [Acidithiobacillus sp.]MDD5379013.1 restriction endonuclease subunit S [Acidithiobacillus sp.]MDD5575742.1 restriction endonuclease subunit S [Acidithiobacillus sp.]